MYLMVFFGIAFILPFLFLRKKEEGNEEILDKRTSRFIKGILCIFVLLHNLGLDYLHTNWPERDYHGWMWIMDAITESTGGIALEGVLLPFRLWFICFLSKAWGSFLKEIDVSECHEIISSRSLHQLPGVHHLLP